MMGLERTLDSWEDKKVNGANELFAAAKTGQTLILISDITNSRTGNEREGTELFVVFLSN